MKIGYDLDGTIFPERPKRPKPFSRQSQSEREAFDEFLKEFYKTSKLVRRPRDNAYFITGRKKKFQTVTEKRLNELGIRFRKVFYMDRPKTRQNLIEFKSEIINRLELDVYYEDDPLIAKELAKRCQDTAIILVSNSLAEPEFMVEKTFVLPESAAKIVERAVSALSKEAGVSRSKAIEFICADFLAGSI